LWTEEEKQLHNKCIEKYGEFMEGKIDIKESKKYTALDKELLKKEKKRARELRKKIKEGKTYNEAKEEVLKIE